MRVLGLLALAISFAASQTLFDCDVRTLGGCCTSYFGDGFPGDELGLGCKYPIPRSSFHLFMASLTST